jgi:hypothetical protein
MTGRERRDDGGFVPRDDGVETRMNREPGLPVGRVSRRCLLCDGSAHAAGKELARWQEADPAGERRARSCQALLLPGSDEQAQAVSSRSTI